MTTVTDARGVVRTRMEGGSILDGEGAAVPLRWQNDDAPLPDEPSPFVYTEFLAEPGSVAGFGGGRGGNLYRNPAIVESFVFVPRGSGLDEAESIAEQIAALFRSYRDDDISCFAATVYPGGDGSMLAPPGMKDAISGNYFWASVEVRLHFDLIG